VELQPHPHVQAVAEDPGSEIAGRQLGENRRKNHFINIPMQGVLRQESPGVPVVILIQNDELDLVFPVQPCQVIKTELALLTALRDILRQPL
jgi:hypothetical protein